ncbi:MULTISPECIES: DUF4166 domain-containing protein [unclassified Sphingopyxis]|jgi:hypothetical protein|uniref:DUF4166 domain-containing protein n=1 Tax=unclassified Sphingopyxis TaxID=2614943 RepID=UPI0006C266A8|nr:MULTISPECIES: DUF4166 domain-containing protein [unclassified Sphingopyxis]USI76157.1 DUF4166 domain-containing protein [Sphingopyxis sp. USTB-05]GAO77143.1 hypothetical protein SC1_00432 [Sphingopyxis sp. C-1]
MRGTAKRMIDAREPAACESGEALSDDRFRRLVPRAAWDALPHDVRQRFSKRLSGTAVATYRGEIVWTRLSRAGWLLAQFCRLIGAPLPTSRSGPAPAAVAVSEDRKSGGQCWTRLYGRARGHPQVIHSAKSFAGPTGLEEHIGGGFGMALAVRAEADALIFTSDHYFWQAAGLRFRIPGWLSPGTTVVTHQHLGSGLFAFDLKVTHPQLGELLNQHGLFRDA